jgi:lysophospholipase L1-like esterase
MSWWWLFPALGGALAAAEAGARAYHKAYFQVPFQNRHIGEYPYDQFIEKRDPPLYFAFRPNFSSPKVNINRFGLRGPQPAPDGVKRRILVMGESSIFGAKLPRERDLWSIRLEHMLAQTGYGGWEVLNAGVPGYNAVQYRHWWETTLVHTRPKILVLQMGANDLTQAYVMGRKWQPGAPWPWEFIMAQRRGTPWWKKPLLSSCIYFLAHRRALTERKGFEAKDNVFLQEQCQATILENARAIVSLAQKQGIRVLIMNLAMAYDPHIGPEGLRACEAIQSNARESLETNGRYVLEFFRYWVEEFAPELDLPALDLSHRFWSHPRRYELYLDVGHWRPKGHALTAQAIFQRIEELGWWK